MNEQLVAVIMSVYKNDNLVCLKDAINSILNQSYDATSLFIYVDGPVPSDIFEYLDILSNHKNIFVHFDNVNKGLASGLNYLIDEVVSLRKFQYVARMDSDDISVLTRITEQVTYMEENPSLAISGTFCEEFGSSVALKVKKLPTAHEKLFRYSCTRCPFIHPSVIFRVSVFEEGYRYPENTTFTEDMGLWFELLNAGKMFGNLDKVLIRYRLDENTLNRRKGLAKMKSEFSLRFNFMKRNSVLNTKDIVLLVLKSLMYISPTFINKILYKYAR